MATEDSKKSLFSELSDHLFEILGGIISLTTFIPIFLNGVDDYIGIENARIGYCVFVFIYFLLPYLAYSFVSFTQSHLDYEQLIPGLKPWTERPLLFAIFVYLCVPLHFMDVAAFVALLAMMTLYTKRTTQYVKQNGILFNEVRIVLVAIIILVVSFSFADLKKNADQKFKKFYTVTEQTRAFRAFENRKIFTTELIKIADSARQKSWAIRTQAAVKKPKLVRPDLNIPFPSVVGTLMARLISIEKTDPESPKAKQVISDFRNSVIALLNADEAFLNNPNVTQAPIILINDACEGMYDYAGAIRQEKTDNITSQWALLMENLRFKSLCWIFLLVFLTTRRWYIMSYVYNSRRKSVGGASYRETREANLSRLKSFIFLLFILAIPWFRTVDANNVDLSRPFINISLSDLITGNSHHNISSTERAAANPPDTTTKKPIVIISHGRDTILLNDTLLLQLDTNKMKLDSNWVKLFRSKFSDTALSDTTMLHKVRTDILMNRKYIKRLIGNPADRR